MIDAFVAADAFLSALESGAPIDTEVFAAIQRAREPDIIAVQQMQLRAHTMAIKPRPLLHLMFTILPLFLPMLNRKIAAAARRQAPLQITHASPPLLRARSA